MAGDWRAQRREAARAAILEAAWRLAERDGIAGLSLRDVAADVGMRAPSLYSYFDSKAALYDAMFAQGNEELLELSRRLACGGGPAREQLIEAGTAFLRFCQDRPARYQLLFQRAVPDFEPSPGSYALAAQALELLADHLRGLGIEGQDALDTWTAVTAGLAAQQLANDPQGDRWRRLVPDVAEMFLARFAPRLLPEAG